MVEMIVEVKSGRWQWPARDVELRFMPACEQDALALLADKMMRTHQQLSVVNAETGEMMITLHYATAEKARELMEELGASTHLTLNIAPVVRFNTNSPRR